MGLETFIMLYWQDLTPSAIRHLAQQDAVIVLPLAAIEQHGEHLPLSTDLDICMGLIEAAGQHLPESLPVCVLPAISVGMSDEHSAFAGSLSLNIEAALATVTALGRSVAAAGFHRLVLFNSHGGNKALVDLAALRLRMTHQMLVVRANYFRFAPPPDVLPAEELRHGLHGGALETAMMLHLAPHKVRREAIDAFPGLGVDLAMQGAMLAPEGEAGLGWMAQDLHPMGVAGDARLASEAMGGRLVAHFGQRLARVIRDAQMFDLARLKQTGHS